MLRNLASWLNSRDAALVAWMARHGVVLLRLSLGLIFLWFGGLKLVPHLSPAEGLAARAIETVSFGLVEASQSVRLLAIVECLIGFGLVTGRLLRLTLGLLWLQMLGTITPLFLFPGEAFTRVPYAPTLEGQYIIKNLVIISASIVIGSTLHGGEAVPEPPEDDRDS